MSVAKLHFIGGMDGSVYESENNSKAYVLKFKNVSQNGVEAVRAELDFISYLGDNGVDVTMPLPSLSGKLLEIIEENDGIYAVIISLSSMTNMNELRNYRIEVGRKTRQIIKQLQPNDVKKRVETVRLKRIFDEGGVLEGSKDLLDFWGRKTIAGILQMPITRHQIVHINDS